MKKKNYSDISGDFCVFIFKKQKKKKKKKKKKIDLKKFMIE